jgi:prophage maintenance system killer protein
VTYSRNNIQYLSPEDLEGVLDAIREDWPDDDVRPRDKTVLDSGLHRPLSSYSDCLLEIATMYFESFAFGHPLVDGNKRLGYFVVTQFLGDNGHEVMVEDQDEAYEFIMSLVKNPPFDKEAFKKWLSENTEPPLFPLN